MFKKVYIEITNNCNLKCPFCTHNKRPNKFMSIEEFKIILDKLKGHTKHLYLHVLGEPLMHPDIIELVNIASKHYNINITTNGYLIDKIRDGLNIRQINISIHSFSKSNHLTLEEYLSHIFAISRKISSKTYINYRLWIKNEHTLKIIEYLNREYQTNLTLENLKENNTLAPNIFLSTKTEFTWPNINSEIKNLKGTCYALKDHLAILVDGSIVPCCLDADGIINLGNIFSEDLDDVINSTRYQNMLKGFKENKKCEALCQRCNFIDK